MTLICGKIAFFKTTANLIKENDTMPTNKNALDIYQKLTEMTNKTSLDWQDLHNARCWLNSNPSQDLIMDAFLSLVSISAKEILDGDSRLDQTRALNDSGRYIATLLANKINILDPMVLDRFYLLFPAGSRKTNPIREDKLKSIFAQMVDDDPYPCIPAIQDYFNKKSIQVMIASEIISSAMEKALQAHDHPSFLMRMLDYFIMLVESVFATPREEKYNSLAEFKSDFDKHKSGYHESVYHNTPEPMKQRKLLTIQDNLSKVATQFKTEAHRSRISFFNIPTLSGEVFDRYEYVSDAFDCIRPG